MSEKLSELMVRICRTIQADIPLGYDRGVISRIRRMAEEFRIEARRLSETDWTSSQSIGREKTQSYDKPSCNVVINVRNPTFTTDYATNREVAFRQCRHPAFDGSPVREQVRQGSINDCGIVATIGAVAGHRPDAIRKAIFDRGDGTYDVTLHELEAVTQPHMVGKPTGNTTTFRVSSDLPYFLDTPHERPAGVWSSTCTWPALIEKAIASEDQAWDKAAHMRWNQRWIEKYSGIDDLHTLYEIQPSPPLGYNRLGVGSMPSDRASVLARITGEEAEVRYPPNEHAPLLSEFKRQLDSDKPVLVGTYEQTRRDIRPFGIYPGHNYEVVRVLGDKLELRNPWGFDHPEPMSVSTFLTHYKRLYVTLK
ncbi:hypothetical protein ACFVUS_25640 [Nocardia sp. NPDC058058]|uniref:hypothetical protein n=1 Tax=Nocardia sp. NPDC058058 TaxID=3346317 RepID=UPI0036DF7AA5